MADTYEEIFVEEVTTDDYQPLVKLKEVKVTTGEEDEDVIWKQRCKVYRFDSSSGEWKERGTGDIKFLKHRATSKIRLIHRQEKTLKLCLNQNVYPQIEMKESKNSDRAMTWAAPDFAEDLADKNTKPGDIQSFSVKFRTPENAHEFKAQWDEARENNRPLMSQS